MAQTVFFNCGKHHLQEMITKINRYAKNGEDIQALIGRIKGLDGVTDIYTGKLSAQEIKQEIFGFLQKKGVSSLESYEKYLEDEGDIKRAGYYTQYTLSDTSIFTLRVIEDEKYIHTHPSRYSPHTFRIRGNTLKTIIITTFIVIRDNKTFTDLDVINEARKKLELSPLAELPSKIGKMLDRIQSYFTA